MAKNTLDLFETNKQKDIRRYISNGGDILEDSSEVKVIVRVIKCLEAMKGRLLKHCTHIAAL